MDGEHFEDEVFNINEDEVEEVIEVDEEDIIVDIDDLKIDELDEMTDEESEGDDFEREDIESPRDDAAVVFRGHQDEVYCVANSNGMIATGGKDDKCFVWSTIDGHVLFECTGHEDSVDSIVFNHNGTYLATGDLKGLVKVWDVKTGQQIWSFEISSIQWLKWHHKANLLLSGSAEGDVWLWNVPYDQTKTLSSHGSSCSCGTFLSDGKRICAGYEDGTVKVWDLKTSACLFSFPKYHESLVICVDCHPVKNLVATGSLDGSILIFNPSSGQLVSKYSVSPKDIKTAEEDEKDRVESLAFCPNASSPYLAIGCGSGKVIIWDTNAALPRFQSLGHVADIVKILWHPIKSNVLMSCSVDGSIIAWDVRSGQQLASYYGHTRRIFGFDLKSDGEEAYTAGADFTARVYKVKL